MLNGWGSIGEIQYAEERAGRLGFGFLPPHGGAIGGGRCVPRVYPEEHRWGSTFTRLVQGGFQLPALFGPARLFLFQAAVQLAGELVAAVLVALARVFQRGVRFFDRLATLFRVALGGGVFPGAGAVALRARALERDDGGLPALVFVGDCRRVFLPGRC